MPEMMHYAELWEIVIDLIPLNNEMQNTYFHNSLYGTSLSEFYERCFSEIEKNTPVDNKRENVILEYFAKFGYWKGDVLLREKDYSQNSYKLHLVDFDKAEFIKFIETNKLELAKQ